MKIPMPTYSKEELIAIQSELISKIQSLRISGVTWGADRIDNESYSVWIEFDAISSQSERAIDFYESSLLIMVPMMAWEMDRRKTGWEGHTFNSYEGTVHYIDEDGISYKDRPYDKSKSIKSIFMMIYFEKEASE